MLHIAELPPIALLDNGRNEQILKLSESGGVIRALSKQLTERFSDSKDDIIGLVLPTGPHLLLAWLALLDAGKTPTILAYPNHKISQIYWRAMIRHTYANLGLTGIVTDTICAEEHLSEYATVFTLTSLPDPIGEECEVVDGSVVQLSSGTTGHKKAIRFPLSTFEHHINLYCNTMEIDAADSVASWLPLYHDMGFVACFLLPLFKGIPLYLMDPMTWISDTSLLLETIESKKATICYMPNFAFEVMSKLPNKYNLTTLRRWVSCSEPTYPDTIRRFCDAHGVSRSTVSTCYAMAENVFAVTQSRGFETVSKDGREYISCGKVLPDTDVEIRDGEIFIRSNTSITSYFDKYGGLTVSDSQGYYPSGDMGFLSDGNLVITGRKRDLLNQAGRKFFLNDLDFLVNKTIPDCNGRAACIAAEDENLGTQALLILIERNNPKDQEFLQSASQRLASVLPLENFRLELVPPSFITKTSSGKINRKRTLEDFNKVSERRKMVSSSSDVAESTASLRREINELLSRSDRYATLDSLLDSLGYLSLQVSAQKCSIDIFPKMTISDVVQQIHLTEKSRSRAEEVAVLKIVSLMDKDQIREMTTEDLSDLSDKLGMPVHWEQICMPPSEIIAHDLLFEEYFLCRYDDNHRDRFSDYVDCIDKLRNASIVLVDDYQEIYFAIGGQVYPLLSFGRERSPYADLLCVRTAKYFRNMHQLPVEKMVHGINFDFTSKDRFHHLVEQIIGAPIFRVAVCEEFDSYTKGWDLRSLRPTKSNVARNIDSFIDKNLLLESLSEFLVNRRGSIRTGTGPGINLLVNGDDGHMCSACVNPDYINAIVNRFDRFFIEGLECSLPFLRNKIEDAGKTFVLMPQNSSLDQFAVDQETPFDCVVQTGSVGTPKTTLPIISLQRADQFRPMNVNLPEDFSLDTIPLYLPPTTAEAKLNAPGA